MLEGSHRSSAARARLFFAVPTLVGATLVFALSGCGESDRDTDDSGTPRGGTGGTQAAGAGGGPAGTGGDPAGAGGRSGSSGAGASSGGGTTGTGGYFDPCASFVPTYNSVCAPPTNLPGGGAGGAGGNAGAAGASAGASPTIDECRMYRPNCPLPGPGVTSGVTVENGLCCISCQTICG